MKVMGIVRRIDDLGRVVIPKEVRRSLGIREGDALEIINTEQGLLLQKCGDANENDPSPKGMEISQENRVFIFRDSCDETHMVTLSKKAEELCLWLESNGMLDDTSWWQVCPEDVEENF